MLPPPVSMTHAHLLACVNTSICDAQHLSRADEAPIRILDAGCGDARMMSYLWRCLRALHPERAIEIYGFDVLDHGVQPAQFMSKALQLLEHECAGVDWSRRLVAIRGADAWPFADGFFDIVVSNQVLEHVHDPQRFFAEHHRVLRHRGRGYHLFPLKHYIYEGHLFLPWVHRIRSWDLMRAYISALSLLGAGKYPEHRRGTGVSRAEFATRHADYIYFWTHYLSEREVVAIVRAVGFRASFRHSDELYFGKLRSLLKMERKVRYTAGTALGDAIGVKLLRYLSSVTLAVEKDNAY